VSPDVIAYLRSPLAIRARCENVFDAARERLDAAHLAEHVMDDVLVELVIGQHVLTRKQRELVGGDERQQRAAAAAHRAVAADDRLGEIDLHLVADLPALAAALVCLDPRRHLRQSCCESRAPPSRVAGGANSTPSWS